jgi:hypothetical protein
MPSVQKSSNEKPGSRISDVFGCTVGQRRIDARFGQPEPHCPTCEEQDFGSGDGPNGDLADALAVTAEARFPHHCEAWFGDGIVAAYLWPSMVEIFHAHRQSRQNPQPPGLKAGSVSLPVQPAQAQL